MQFAHRGRLFVVLNAVVVQEQSDEARLVEVATGFVGRAGVQGEGVVEEVQISPEDLGAPSKFLVGLLEPMLGLDARHSDLLESRVDPLPRHRAIHSEVEQAFLLRVELRQLLPVLGVKLDRAGLQVSHRLLSCLQDGCSEVAVEAKGRVVVGDVVLDVGHGKVRQVADAFLSSTAQEVAVEVGATTGLGVDDPRQSACGLASCAEQEALEIVVVRPVTLPTVRVVIQHLLDGLVQIGRDQWLVTTWERLALVGNDPDVVRVAEHVV